MSLTSAEGQDALQETIRRTRRTVPGSVGSEANEFVARQMEKPLHESMVDANFRFFADPPEWIQVAFGGREWFLETGCQQPHRIGLYLGLGWKLNPLFETDGINAVKITADTVGHGLESTYTIRFGTLGTTENLSHFDEIDSAQGRLEDLKRLYGERLGDRAL